MSLASQDRWLSVSPLVHLEGEGGRTLGDGGVEIRVSHPFSSPLPHSPVLLPIPSYSPSSIKGKALHGEVLSSISKGAVELAPPSRLLRPSVRSVEGNGHLSRFVQLTSFKMETNQSVLHAAWRDDWMFSIDLKDAYLQLPIHPDCRRYLRFVADGQVHQLEALCFGLSTAPQVFTRVMVPVSVIHDMGVRVLWYLHDWLILASSRVEAL